MKEIKNLFITTVVILFTACSTEPHSDYVDVAKRSRVYFEQDKKKNSKNFVFPDSVLNKPLIATYFEADAMANSIIFYTDTSKQQARAIRYFADGNILYDQLKQLKSNEFASLLRPAEYVITDSAVNYIMGSKTPNLSVMGAGLVGTHVRTDVN